MDFAMSYSCEYQNEVQSALWSRNSVNLFTMALFVKDEKCRSFIGVTDSHDKGKDTVYAFVMRLCDYILEEKLDLGNMFCFFTDGPSAEFKNKYMVKLLRDIGIKLNKEVRWNFFATSHGKGVVDGIGGSAKSLVRRRVMARQAVVQNSMDFHETVAEIMPSVTAFHFKESEIKDIIFDKNPWEGVLEASGIRSIHSIVMGNDGMHFYPTSLEEEKFVITEYGQQSCSFYKIGQWVVVDYDGKKYPGEVTALHIEAELVEVSVMHSKFGQTWAWPVKEDKILYSLDRIVKTISPPIPADRRNHFKFQDQIC